MQVGLLSVTYDGKSKVIITAQAQTTSMFDQMLESGQEIRRYFEPSKPAQFADWGCDGVGYACQKRVLRVALYRSGVGPKNYQAGLVRLRIAGYPVVV